MHNLIRTVIQGVNRVSDNIIVTITIVSPAYQTLHQVVMGMIMLSFLIRPQKEAQRNKLFKMQK